MARNILNACGPRDSLSARLSKQVDCVRSWRVRLVMCGRGVRCCAVETRTHPLVKHRRRADGTVGIGQPGSVLAVLLGRRTVCLVVGERIVRPLVEAARRVLSQVIKIKPAGVGPMLVILGNGRGFTPRS